MVFVDRDPDRQVKHLTWRVRLFGGGAILALVGIYFNARWLIWAAMAVLVVGFLLRFAPTPDGEGEGEAE